MGGSSRQTIAQATLFRILHTFIAFKVIISTVQRYRMQRENTYDHTQIREQKYFILYGETISGNFGPHSSSPSVFIGSLEQKQTNLNLNCSTYVGSPLKTPHVQRFYCIIKLQTNKKPFETPKIKKIVPSSVNQKPDHNPNVITPGPVGLPGQVVGTYPIHLGRYPGQVAGIHPGHVPMGYSNQPTNIPRPDASNCLPWPDVGSIPWPARRNCIPWSDTRKSIPQPDDRSRSMIPGSCSYSFTWTDSGGLSRMHSILESGADATLFLTCVCIT